MTPLTPLVPFFRAGFAFDGAPRAGVSLKINITGTADDAALVSLSRPARVRGADPGAAPGAVEAAPPRRQAGLLQRMLESVAGITSEMRALRAKASQGLFSAEQKSAADAEIARLGAEYDRIVTSDSYRRIVDLTEQAARSMRAGDGCGSLDAERALLGDQFLTLVRQGQLFKIDAISRSLSGISAVDGAGLAGDEAQAESVHAAAVSVLEILSGAPEEQQTLELSAAAVSGAAADPIRTIQMTFAGAEETALALRSYSPQDMLKLAAAHVEMDHLSVLTLVHNPLKEEGYGEGPDGAYAPGDLFWQDGS